MSPPSEPPSYLLLLHPTLSQALLQVPTMSPYARFLLAIYFMYIV